MNIKRQASFTRLIWTSSAAAILLVGTGLTTPAFAQSGQVSVDLSVLDDGGYGPATIPGYAGGATKLLMPGASAPRSTYVGPAVTVTAPILSVPAAPAATTVSSETTSTSTLSTEDTVPPPAPAAAEPAEPEVPDVLTAQPDPEPEVEESSGETVALSPSDSEAPPPAAPEPVEEQSTVSAASDDASDESISTDQDTTETAAVTPTAGAAATPGRALQVVFPASESKLSGTMDDELSVVANQIKESDNLRVQLMAYAGGDDLSASKARRLSLSRALSVRSFFIENKVRSTRIDVRALGDKTNEEPLNRVDVIIVER